MAGGTGGREEIPTGNHSGGSRAISSRKWEFGRRTLGVKARISKSVALSRRFWLGFTWLVCCTRFPTGSGPWMKDTPVPPFPKIVVIEESAVVSRLPGRFQRFLLFFLDDRRPAVSDFFLFARSEHAAHDRRVEFVLALDHVSRIIFYVHDENRQIALFFESLVRQGYRQYAVEIPLAVGGFITMPLDVPGEDTNLIEVERHAVLVFGEQNQVLRNFLVAVADFVEDK